MHLGHALLLGPASLLLGTLAQADLPRMPVAVRKMGLDEGEKFYPEHYFAFDDYEEDVDADATSTSRRALFFGQRSPAAQPLDAQPRRWPVAVRSDSSSLAARSEDNDSGHNASSALSPFLPPFAKHDSLLSSSSSLNLRGPADALARLWGRDWSCPSGTSSCESIGYPYSCCSEGESCYEVTDTGSGSVGCCPEGDDCSGSVSSCNDDATSCAATQGGGCCIAGYVCEGVGCVKSTSTSSTSTTASTSVTAIATVTTTSSSTTPTTTSTTTPTSTSTATATATSSSVTTTDGIAPVRPTSASGTGTASYCPTGYYACLAQAGGGCCQTGRDCQTTSCPPLSTSTVADLNGVTVVVRVSSNDATTTEAASTATCATGWFLCGTDAGTIAGCCPSGYSCGTASCTLSSDASATAEATAQATVQKELPSKGGRLSPDQTWWWLALWLATAMVMM